MENSSLNLFFRPMKTTTIVKFYARVVLKSESTLVTQIYLGLQSTDKLSYINTVILYGHGRIPI